LETFIQEVFYNIDELRAHHRRLLDKLFEIQREEHPIINSIAAPMYDAVSDFREAYLKYIPNYPIAAYRIDDEIANNPQFKDFVDVSSFLSFIAVSVPMSRTVEFTVTGSFSDACGILMRTDWILKVFSKCLSLTSFGTSWYCRLFTGKPPPATAISKRYLQFWTSSKALERIQSPDSCRLNKRLNCGGVTRTWFSGLGSMSYVYFSFYMS
jgi:hypothetical protein